MHCSFHNYQAKYIEVFLHSQSPGSDTLPGSALCGFSLNWHKFSAMHGL